LIQTIQRAPIVPLPGTELVVQSQIKQCHYCLVDLVSINVHRPTPGLPNQSSEPTATHVKHADRLTLTLLGQMHANILRLFYSLWSRKQMALLG